ncbi:hypothetical protein H0H93_010396 [Arthromyces matolae]|nr:hypothetical protein H0H93_010396 [Arthromyces matolae]
MVDKTHPSDRENLYDISASELPPLPSDNDSIVSVDSTSSMDYINAQLLAHGFVQSPGIVLGEISSSDSERIVKCLLGMLSQRVEDMARTEELNTKLRTLTYDYERMKSLHRDATEVAANAEREANVHKSRLLAATRALQASESAHKQTSAELQRTRTILQGVRTTHQTELKKKEKDIDRMTEKWSKIADAQAKLMATPSGLKCSNVSVITGLERTGNGTSFMEIALEEAEKTMDQLTVEHLSARRLVVTTINQVQTALYQTRPAISEKIEEPTPYTIATLFPLHPPGNAEEKTKMIMANLRDALTSRTHKTSAESALPAPKGSISEDEVRRLQGVIDNLQQELGRSGHLVHPVFFFFTFVLQIGRASNQRNRQNKYVPCVSLQSSHRSPHKSPAKVRVGKAGAGASRKTTRMLRRSSILTPPKIIPSYETEVLLPLGAMSFTSKPLSTSLLPNTFVLPPPSPHTSLPTQPAILHSVPSLNFDQVRTPPQSTTPLSPTPSPPDNAEMTAPSTPPPARPLFPIAKSLAERMIHAYSPAKPSPLSRILMLGKSPNSPEPVGLRFEDSSLLECATDSAPPAMVLTPELNAPDSPPESPLQEKKIKQNVAEVRGAKKESKRYTAQEKGKIKPLPAATVRNNRTSAGLEKENKTKTSSTMSTTLKVSPPGAINDKKDMQPLPKSTGHSTSRSKPTKPPPTGGPRRVLVTSEEAPVGKWRS